MEEKIGVIRRMTEPVIRELGYDLYFVEFGVEEEEEFLRFYIENPSGEPITLDDCAKVSRAISPIIDENDPIDSAYYLEVSSPGLFRQLFTPEQILGAVGERVRVRLMEDAPGKKNFLGILSAFDGETLTLQGEGDQAQIAYDKVRLIQLEPDV